MNIVYDIEIFVNFFCVTFYNIESDKSTSFYIFGKHNDSQVIRDYLKDTKLLIGYNNLSFDYRLLHMILTGEPTVGQLHKMAQRLIGEERVGWIEPLIPQLDLLKLNHYDFEGRQASLKWLQINMGMKSVQDMPFEHTHKVRQQDIEDILEYNLNDVIATYELWKRSQSLIQLRALISEKYGMDMSNFSNAKMGESILLKMLEQRTGTDIKVLKKCRTVRNELKLKDCILPSVTFRTPEFQKILETFQSMVVKVDTKRPEMCAVLDGCNYYFGLGGIHACRGAGIYHNIRSLDATGFYPSLAVAQKFSPAHFGKDFSDVYGQIAIERAQYPKDDPFSKGLKEAQVSVFGKSKNEYSPFYDIKLFYQITINGQLLLAMLCERITTYGAGRIIMANTDGIEVDVIDDAKYEWLCEEFVKKFGVKLEHVRYKKMFVRDVNSYLNIYDNGKIKQKNDFVELPELHKNQSMKIVANAVRKYFVDNTPIEKTINECNDISMFLMGARAKTGKFYLQRIENNEVIREPLPKHIRYYIGGNAVLMKKDSNVKNVHKGFTITMFNDWTEPPYKINKQFYIKEANKLINSVVTQAKYA